ncbi:MAG: ATP-binding protein, partial [Bdellovibrionales bacterium]|nr:ATP-binding protein [Bdellovibrionales bacterium]
LKELWQFTNRVLKVGTDSDKFDVGAFGEKIDVRDACVEVVERKRLEIAGSKKDIAFTLDIEKELDLFALGQRIDFEAIISDLLDNSIEAIDDCGQVKVILTQASDDQLRIDISDNGKGISKELLPRLMHYRITHGKPEGTGLGLYSAKKTVEAMKGSISIVSKAKYGTIVTITIPLLQPEKLDLPRLNLESGQTLVIVEDDVLVQQAWSIRLETLKNKMNLVMISSADEFESWIDVHGISSSYQSRQYIFDYDLKSKDHTGLSLIQKYGLQLESLLITGMAENRLVQEGAKRANVRLYSKDVLAEMPITLNEIESLGLSRLAAEIYVNV